MHVLDSRVYRSRAGSGVAAAKGGGSGAASPGLQVRAAARRRLHAENEGSNNHPVHKTRNLKTTKPAARGQQPPWCSSSCATPRRPHPIQPRSILESNIPGRRVPARTTCANRTSEKDRSSPATVKHHVSRSHRARRPPQSRVEASVCSRSTNRSRSRSSLSRSAGSPRLRRTRSPNIAARGSVLQILAAHGSVRHHRHSRRRSRSRQTRRPRQTHRSSQKHPRQRRRQHEGQHRP